MALTKISRGLLSTGVSDSSDATAITIDSSERVGISNTSPSATLDVASRFTVASNDGHSDTKISSTSNRDPRLYFLEGSTQRALIQSTAGTSQLLFSTGTSERMRIDSSGNVMVGSTSSSSTTGHGHKFNVDGTKPYIASVVDTNENHHSNYHHYNVNASYNGYRFYIRNNGGVINYSGNNVNLSDEKVKTNIELSGNYLEKICNIPVKLFNYKDEPEGVARSLGVIAQDVEAFAPELINNEGFGDTPEDGVPLKTVYTTDMMYALMKAIQELSAKVEELESKIDG